MYSRLLDLPADSSTFLFGPRGTGKSFWLKQKFPNSITFDFLDAKIFNDLIAAPDRLGIRIPQEAKRSG